MAYRGIPSIALNTATDQRLRESSRLREFGVKGMKWGVRKQTEFKDRHARLADRISDLMGKATEWDSPKHNKAYSALEKADMLHGRTADAMDRGDFEKAHSLLGRAKAATVRAAAHMRGERPMVPNY